MDYRLIVKKIRQRPFLTCFALITVGAYIVYCDLYSSLYSDLYFPHWSPHDRDDVLAVMEDISCHYIVPNDTTLPYADSDDFVPPSRSIFFHETSCKGNLDSRQACAVESAARAHPDWQVNVLFSSMAGLALNRGSLSLLQNFSNVRLARAHVVKYARNTPLEGMIADGALNRSRWRISHTSDVLRYLSLYKFGGVYLDMDVIVAKTLDPLARNWAPKESDTIVASFAMAMSKDNIGRSVAKAAIQDIKNNFRGDLWANNGPGVITRVLQKRCSTDNTMDMSAATCNVGPDAVLTDRSHLRAVVVDITIPHHEQIIKTEKEKVSKYLDLAQDHEGTAMWDVDSTISEPIIVFATGLIAKSFDQYNYGIKYIYGCAYTEGFEVYAPLFFNPLEFKKGHEYFNAGEMKGEGPSYIFHVWNKLTGYLYVDRDSPYAKLARKYCPSVYKLYDEDFLLPVINYVTSLLN